MKDKEKKFDTVGDLPFDIPLAVAPETEEDGLHRNSLLQFPLGPAYGLTGHKAQGLTMFMTYISFLKFWGYGLPYTLATRTPFLHNIHFVGVPPRDIYHSLFERDQHGLNKIERKRVEIQAILKDDVALKNEVCLRIQKGEFVIPDGTDENVVLDKVREYYEQWLRRLSVCDGLETMTQVSTAFKLHQGRLRCQDWINAVLPFDSQSKTEAERWPTLKQVFIYIYIYKSKKNMLVT